MAVTKTLSASRSLGGVSLVVKLFWAKTIDENLLKKVKNDTNIIRRNFEIFLFKAISI